MRALPSLEDLEPLFKFPIHLSVQIYGKSKAILIKHRYTPQCFKYNPLFCSFSLQVIFFSEQPFYGNYPTLDSYTNTVILTRLPTARRYRRKPWQDLYRKSCTMQWRKRVKRSTPCPATHMGSSGWHGGDHGGHHQSGLVRLKSWFSNRTGTSVDDEKARDGTSGAQFAALPLVKPVAWFAGAVVNWRPRSVAKSDKPAFRCPFNFWNCKGGKRSPTNFYI